MRYCRNCVYPENTAVGMAFDEEGVCAGCHYFEALDEVDWSAREKRLKTLLDGYKDSGNDYDCLIPVSGGKDSHYQAYLIKEVYGLKPLLATFNHACNPWIGIKNMQNIVEKFEVDHVRVSPNPALLRKLMKYTLEKRGDAAWFCQTGVVTTPVQIAVQYKIPLIIWGEHGWSHLFGKNLPDEMVEFTLEEREALFMRGLTLDQVVADNPDISRRDLSWAEYPSDEDIKEIGIRGIYLGNYIEWRQKENTDAMIEKYGFTARPKARTYNTYADADCHMCSGTNDYLKYLKFGYGRCTDHASQDIREGRITREEGLKLVNKYDPVRPEDLDTFLKELNITEEHFMSTVENMRDPSAWEKLPDGAWHKIPGELGEVPVDEAEIEKIEAKLGFQKNWDPDDIDTDWYF